MSFLIYGAYGYTGTLIAREAVRRGLRPVLGGRDAARLEPLARALGLEHRTFALDAAAAVDASLADVPLVLNAAGPFARTAVPMAEACLRTQTHYLDVTGEIPVFERLAAMAGRAQAAGVVLLPGVGFDVVPTDCLALHLKLRLPSASRLELAIRGETISRGTATTMVENLSRGGAIRRNGRIERVPAAWRTRTVDFGRGPTSVVSIPWGDVATAYHTTGIPDVTTYAAVTAAARRLMVLSRYVGPLLSLPPVKALLKALIGLMPPGPTEAQRAEGRSYVWGEATDDAGGRAVARLVAPEGYALTAQTAVAAAQRVLDGKADPGFQTPAGAFGSDFIRDFEGVRRDDVA